LPQKKIKFIVDFFLVLWPHSFMPEFGLELLIDVEHNRAHITVFYDADQSENELLFMKMGERPASFGA
jgi:hypothetical protein